MAKLAINQIYDLRVLKISEDYEQFSSKSDASKMMHCHGFILGDDEGNEYKTQICDTCNKQLYADVDDMISVTVTNLSLELYSIKYIRTIHKAEKKSFNTNVPSNPIVGGSAAAIAMSLSIEYSKYKDESAGDDIYTRADGIFEWLKNKV